MSTNKYRTMTIKTAMIQFLTDYIEENLYRIRKQQESEKYSGTEAISDDTVDKLTLKHRNTSHVLKLVNQKCELLISRINDYQASYNSSKLDSFLAQEQEIDRYKYAHVGYDEKNAEAMKIFITVFDKLSNLSYEYHQANKKRQVRTPFLREVTRNIAEVRKNIHNSWNEAARELKSNPSPMNILLHQHTIVFCEEYTRRVTKIWSEICDFSPKIADLELRNYISKQIDEIRNDAGEFEAGTRSLSHDRASQNESRLRACNALAETLDDLMLFGL